MLVVMSPIYILIPVLVITVYSNIMLEKVLT